MRKLSLLPVAALVGLGFYLSSYADDATNISMPTPDNLQTAIQGNEAHNLPINAADSQPIPEVATTQTTAPSTNTSKNADAVEQRAQEENKIANNPFAVSFYQPNYILPFNYTQFPDNNVYNGQTPDNQQISHYDVKFQLSLKYPLWNFNDFHKLYVAYTQMSYWQAYQNSAFFRETNYEP